jgi:eukaryotic-like serine/threonine-protein kinase
VPFELLIPLAPFASAVLITKWVLEHKRERLKLEVGRGKLPELEALRSERRLLIERIENLETIVCSVDFELNQKLARVIDEQKLLQSGAGVAPMKAVEVPRVAVGAVAGVGNAAARMPGDIAQKAQIATDRTMTAALGKPRSASAGELVPGDVLTNRYRIQRLLGRGGMGAVYLADDEVLGELVALKVISSAWASDEAAMVERFKREAAAARRVSSPSVIRIHDLGEARPGLLYLSMEYFPGRTLGEVIAQRGLVPLADCRDYLGQICAGLAAAHDAGVVHRDLKPGNILVGERSAVKIIDFGLAKATAVEGLTATGMLLGTPHYMAPEQIRGKNCDARADIYALGALAYHLVTGRPPFSGDNAIAIGFAHLTEAVTPPRQLRADLPEALDQAILAALAKDPAARPAGALAFRQAIG